MVQAHPWDVTEWFSRVRLARAMSSTGALSMHVANAIASRCSCYLHCIPMKYLLLVCVGLGSFSTWRRRRWHRIAVYM